MSKINDEPLAVAGYENNKVESYKFETDTWTGLDDYPYHDKLEYYATVSTNQGAFIIGGRMDSSNYVSTIACFNGNEWSLIGNLNSPRAGHSAIINGDNVFIVGGYPNDLPTEIWSVKENELYLHLTEPELTNYSYYPELLLVDPDYCTGNQTIV